jgi:hypothetical protein
MELYLTSEIENLGAVIRSMETMAEFNGGAFEDEASVLKRVKELKIDAEKRLSELS